MLVPEARVRFGSVKLRDTEAAAVIWTGMMPVSMSPPEEVYVKLKENLPTVPLGAILKLQPVREIEAGAVLPEATRTVASLHVKV